MFLKERRKEKKERGKRKTEKQNSTEDRKQKQKTRKQKTEKEEKKNKQIEFLFAFSKLFSDMLADALELSHKTLIVNPVFLSENALLIGSVCFRHSEELTTKVGKAWSALVVRYFLFSLLSLLSFPSVVFFSHIFLKYWKLSSILLGPL